MISVSLSLEVVISDSVTEMLDGNVPLRLISKILLPRR